MKKRSNQNFGQIGENISKLMDAFDVDATTLSQNTGLPCSTISRLRSNTIEFSPNLSTLLPIADFFQVTVSQLIGEEPFNNQIQNVARNNIKHRSVPILNPEDVVQHMNSRAILNTSTVSIDIPLSKHSFAYFVRGNAMEPQFPDNTLLLIDPKISVENLDFVLLLAKDKKVPIFRQILIDGEDRYIRTLNPEFNEFIKLSDDYYSILGVMAQSRRSFKDNVSTTHYIAYESRQIKAS